MVLVHHTDVKFSVFASKSHTDRPLRLHTTRMPHGFVFSHPNHTQTRSRLSTSIQHQVSFDAWVVKLFRVFTWHHLFWSFYEFRSLATLFSDFSGHGGRSARTFGLRSHPRLHRHPVPRRIAGGSDAHRAPGPDPVRASVFSQSSAVCVRVCLCLFVCVSFVPYDTMQTLR